MLTSKECDQLMDVVSQLADPSSTLGNYVLPGLSSTLLSKGKLRLFTSERYTEEFIAPHSHRFNFACLVLRGDIWNTVYTPTEKLNSTTNPWSSFILYPEEGGLGKYRRTHETGLALYDSATTQYRAGQVYSMRYEDIHSIRFSREAAVLFIEGPQVINWSRVLIPTVCGDAGPAPVDNFKIEPWMFVKSN